MNTKLLLALTVCAAPANAWDFSSDPICTLSYKGTAMTVTVTYDASLPEYAISLSRPVGWPASDIFSIRFEGPRGLTISTTRHEIEGLTLTARDTGFGNVLDGLEFNTRAVAILGSQEVAVDLQGIDPAITQFRACPADLFS